ncbi:MAG: NADPH:quinone oxidoreductase family protein [Pseudomonadota bacterium]|nr:NADPH:quinone oxidoreductase family protein [Pseudomonadota bacterium]
MRSIRVSSLDGVDTLTLEDIPPPVAGPEEVRIEVHVGGVNFPDLLMSEGKYQHKPNLPFTPGLEMAGKVIEVGHSVTRFVPGDRVMGFFDYGAFAEEAVVPEKYLMAVPGDMDWETAGGFMLTHTTSHAALVHERVNLKASEILLVHGAAGGVGTTAVQIGKALGCTVIATTGSDEKAQFALDNGADYAINYSSEDIRDRVKELAGGADVVYDPVGGDAFSASLRCTNFEGRIIIIGFASGTIANAPANYVLVKNISIVGFPVGTYRRTSPEILNRSYAGLTEMWAAGQLKPQQSHVFPLEQTSDAIKALRDRKAMGKVVIKVRDEE